MELGSRDAALTLGTGLLWLAGIALIIFGDLPLAVLGIVLIVSSTIVFLVDAKDLLVKTEEHAGE